MLTASLAAIYARDLAALRAELEAYPADGDLWRTVPGIANAGGTLALHLSGNLQHFIGAVLGDTGYVRNRDREFSARDLPRAELLQDADAAAAAVAGTLARLTDSDLAKEYPLTVATVRLNTGDFLTHLAVHFAYHLGQLDYHRRTVTGAGPVAGALSPMRLASAVKTDG